MVEDNSNPSAGGLSLRVLLAEDQPINQKVAIGMLERLGHQVVAVSDGRQALNVLHNSDFDLVLMDGDAGNNGFAAIQAIRQAGHDGPTHAGLALTAHAMQGDRERCLEAGFDGYLTKPIRRDDLKTALHNMDHDSWPAVHSENTMFATLIAACEGDEDLAQELAEDFLTTVPRCLTEIAPRSEPAIRKSSPRHPMDSRESARRSGHSEWLLPARYLKTRGEIRNSMQFRRWSPKQIGYGPNCGPTWCSISILE